MSGHSVMRFDNHHGVPLVVRLVQVGETYGRHGGLTNTFPDRSLVEFYDARFEEGGFPGLGQFISRYYLDTLANSVRADRLGTGLQLDGSVPEWSVSPEHLRVVLGWANHLSTSHPATNKSGDES